MRSRDFAPALLLAVAVALSCTPKSTAPPNWLPRPMHAAKFERGGWAELTYGHGKQPARVDGELIAIDHDSVFVLADSTLAAVHSTDVRDLTIWLESGGTPVTTHVYQNSKASLTTKQLQAFAKYSRFPQGLPAGIDRGALQPR